LEAIQAGPKDRPSGPGSDIVTGGVPHGSAFVCHVSITGPQSAFPFAKIQNLLFGELELVECPEKSAVVGKLGETSTVDMVGVVQARILCFHRFQAAVKSLGLDANFCDEKTKQILVEIHGIVRSGSGINIAVNAQVNRNLTPHGALRTRSPGI